MREDSFWGCVEVGLEFRVSLTIVFDGVGPWRGLNNKLRRLFTMDWPRPRALMGHVPRDVDKSVQGKFFLPVDVRQVLAWPFLTTAMVNWRFRFGIENIKRD